MLRHCTLLFVLARIAMTPLGVMGADADEARTKDGINVLDDPLPPSSWLRSPDPDGLRSPPNRLLKVQVEECMDTADWFGTRNSEGINLWRTFYDCRCAGDLRSYYTFSCRLDNYCYVDQWNEDAAEMCVNHEINYDFSVNSTTGVIDTIEKGYHCVDYLKGGPRERLCYVDANVCALKMKDRHSFSTEASADICSGRPTQLYGAGWDGIARCPEILIDQLGYAEERARELCANVTMGGTECLEYDGDECRERTGETRDEMVIYVPTPDCSNVEPCAESYCQARKVVLPRPEKVMLYPKCKDLSQDPQSMSPPSLGAPTTKPDASVSPVPTDSPQTGDVAGMEMDPPTNSPVETEPRGIKVKECMDTADWFGTRGSGGVNLLREFFDCDCSGDLSSYYSFRCRLDNYCYVDQWNDNATEICVNRNISYDFSVDSGVIKHIEKGYHCVDYLKAGPRERMCFVDTNVCALTMKDKHSFSTEASAATCSDRARCPEILVDELGYEEDRARELCPNVTMGGTDCLEYRNEPCKERTGETRDEMIVYTSTHDCSNVEPCAKPYCQARKVVLPRPEKVHLYPECKDLSRETVSPTNSPLEMSASTTSPSNSPLETSAPTRAPMVNNIFTPPATDPTLVDSTPIKEISECDDLDAQAQALYNGGSCVLVKAIIEESNLLVGTKLSTCSFNTSCIDGISEVVERIADQNCSVAGRGVISVIKNRNQFDTIAEFFCGEANCYSSIRSMINSCPGGVTDDCLEAVSCECIDNFLEVTEKLPGDFQKDYIVPGDIVLVKWAQEKCTNALSVVSNGSTMLPDDKMSLTAAAVIVGYLLM